MVDGIAKTGKPVTGFGIEGTGDIGTIAKASRVAKDYLQWASELQREECDILRPVGLDQVRRERHHHRPRLLPDRRQHVRQADPARHLRRVRRDLRDHRRRASRQGARHRRRRSARSGYKVWQAYEDEVIEAHKTDDLSDSQPTKGNIAGGLTTIEEKALGNLEKIGRECRYIDVLEPAEAPAQGPGPLLHGHVVGGGRMRDPDGGGGLRGAHLPDRPGQRDRQSDRAGDQDHRQSAHRAHHVGAYRPRRVRHPAPRDDASRRPATR